MKVADRQQLLNGPLRIRFLLNQPPLIPIVKPFIRMFQILYRKFLHCNKN